MSNFRIPLDLYYRIYYCAGSSPKIELSVFPPKEDLTVVSGKIPGNTRFRLALPRSEFYSRSPQLHIACPLIDDGKLLRLSTDPSEIGRVLSGRSVVDGEVQGEFLVVTDNDTNLGTIRLWPESEAESMQRDYLFRIYMKGSGMEGRKKVWAHVPGHRYLVGDIQVTYLGQFGATAEHLYVITSTLGERTKVSEVFRDLWPYPVRISSGFARTSPHIYWEGKDRIQCIATKVRTRLIDLGESLVPDLPEKIENIVSGWASSPSIRGDLDVFFRKCLWLSRYELKTDQVRGIEGVRDIVVGLLYRKLCSEWKLRRFSGKSLMELVRSEPIESVRYHILRSSSLADLLFSTTGPTVSLEILRWTGIDLDDVVDRATDMICSTDFGRTDVRSKILGEALADRVSSVTTLHLEYRDGRLVRMSQGPVDPVISRVALRILPTNGPGISEWTRRGEVVRSLTGKPIIVMKFEDLLEVSGPDKDEFVGYMWENQVHKLEVTYHDLQ